MSRAHRQRRCCEPHTIELIISLHIGSITDWYCLACIRYFKGPANASRESRKSIVSPTDAEFPRADPTQTGGPLCSTVPRPFRDVIVLVQVYFTVGTKGMQDGSGGVRSQVSRKGFWRHVTCLASKQSCSLIEIACGTSHVTRSCCHLSSFFNFSLRSLLMLD